MACENGCTYTVHAHRDHPDDPAYPLVVCPFCMTRWYGHREDRESKMLDTRLPAALRDAVILDQAERAFEILEHELGYTQAVRPNGIIGASTGVLILPTQQAQFVARPQCDDFIPTHFITNVGGFAINDIRVGNSSMFLQSGDLPSEAFRVNLVAPELRLRPGQDIGVAFIDLVEGDVTLPLACSAFRWQRVRGAKQLTVVATNISNEESVFTSWFLGIQRSGTSSARALRTRRS